MNEILRIMLRNQGLMLQLLSGLCGDKKTQDKTFEFGAEIISFADELQKADAPDIAVIGDVMKRAFENGERDK